MYKSVFIELESQDWILNILANDIQEGMEKMGYQCRKGKYEDYIDEDISFHMWWGQTQPHKNAKVNAIFITHTDDKYKEAKLKRIKDDFDLFFCMSSEDARFLVELGYDDSKVFGIELPIRNTYVRPITIGIFSRCYPDKRKNEEWLFDFCKNNDSSRYVDFVFIGDGWGDFVERLSKIGCSFQWHNVSRSMPYEYLYQQLKMANLDYYIYMGMDGGAMGSYDAYAMGASLCISDDGFHKGIPDIDYSFKSEKEFHACLKSITERQIRKLKFFYENNAENYVENVVYVIENKKSRKDDNIDFTYSVLEKRRENYFDRGFVYGIKDFLSTTFHNWINMKKLEKGK